MFSMIVGPFVDDDEGDSRTTAADTATTDDEDESRRSTTTEREETTTERETTTTERETTTAAEPTTTTTEPATTTTERPPTTESPAETVAQAVDDALGDSNRDVDRLQPVTLVDGHLAIRWAINENLTEGLTKDTARVDATDILRVVRESGVAYHTVTIEGTYPLVDELGNASEERVVLATYPADLVNEINFDGFDFKNVFDISDDALVHPAFQY